MGFFKNLKKSSKPTAPPPSPSIQRERVAKHLSESWVNNLLVSAEETDKRMKAAGYIPMDLGGRKFDGELQVNPLFKRQTQRPKTCPGCGAPTGQKLKCDYCGSGLPW